MVGFRFQARRGSGWKAPVVKRLAVGKVTICGAASCCLKAAAAAYVSVDLNHALRSFSSAAASATHDIPCRRCLARFVHISSSLSSSCSFDIENMRHKKPGRR